MLQGYIVYAVKQKLKQEYCGLPGNEIKNLKTSGVEVCLGIMIGLSLLVICKQTSLQVLHCSQCNVYVEVL